MPAASSFDPFADVKRHAVLQVRDPKAFRVLMEREHDRLYHVVLRMIKDEEEAINVVQETFVQAFQRIDSFRGHAKLSTWLCGIAVNQARLYLRRAKRYTRHGTDDLERLYARGAVRHADAQYALSPQVHLERQERAALVQQAIAQLPEKYRRIVMLRDLQQLSTEETAQALNLNAGTVRVQLHRARHALRRMLAPELEHARA